MQRKKREIGMITTGVLLVLVASFWMGSITPVNAQCGSQASSCKNCHEVHGEYPVNNDGTAWHQSHAFGDFCYICHAGNNQATDISEAHAGMVPPLADIKAACQQCHFDDLEERAQVYAGTLGVEIGSGADGNSGSGGDPVEGSAPESTGIGLMAPTELDIKDPNLVDYVQRYNELVLGEYPINKGNLIVGALIGLVLLGGGTFVIYNEGWVGVDYEKVDEYPAEMVALLPKISRLTPPAREKLKNMLADPQQADDVLSQLPDGKDQKK
jgi:hypothetical protein